MLVHLLFFRRRIPLCPLELDHGYLEIPRRLFPPLLPRSRGPDTAGFGRSGVEDTRFPVSTVEQSEPSSGSPEAWRLPSGHGTASPVPPPPQKPWTPWSLVSPKNPQGRWLQRPKGGAGGSAFEGKPWFIIGVALGKLYVALVGFETAGFPLLPSTRTRGSNPLNHQSKPTIQS